MSVALSVDGGGPNREAETTAADRDVVPMKTRLPLSRAASFRSTVGAERGCRPHLVAEEIRDQPQDVLSAGYGLGHRCTRLTTWMITSKFIIQAVKNHSVCPGLTQ